MGTTEKNLKNQNILSFHLLFASIERGDSALLHQPALEKLIENITTAVRNIMYTCDTHVTSVIQSYYFHENVTMLRGPLGPAACSNFLLPSEILVVLVSVSITLSLE
jgi:hypothetical protein